MQITVRGRNLDVTKSLRDHVTKKIGKIERHLDQPITHTAQVTLGVEKDRHIVEVTIPLNGMLLRSEEATHDMYASVDLVVDKLERQLRKYKTRLAKKVRGAQPIAPEADESLDTAVVKTKRFAMKPMTVDEAIMQMDLLGHDFFVFANGETEQINVVYKRKDGAYGLIEPEA